MAPLSPESQASSDAHRYPDDPARCAEILRVALPQMTRQSAGAHPVSYAVWFEHVSGSNARLSEALNQVTQGGRLLDERTTAQLYRDYVASDDEQATMRVAEGIRRVISDVSESAKVAGAQTDRFGSSLDRFSHSVERGQVPDPAALQDVLQHTQDMRASMTQLSTRLEANQQEIERLRSEVNRARNEALSDPLTGLPNRRAFDLAIAEAGAHPQQAQSIIVADIDHFKRINDDYGHLFGDTVLKVVAAALKSCVAPPQTVARVGGEEFAVVLPATELPAALALAEHIRTTIAGARIRRRDRQETIGQVTLSFGVAQRLPGESPADWFERADRALYASKSAGRNRATAAKGVPLTPLKPATATS